MSEFNVDKVKLSYIKKVIKRIEEQQNYNTDILDNMEIPFEFIMTTFFPTALNNLREQMTQQYIEGVNNTLKEFAAEDGYTKSNMYGVIQNIKEVRDYAQLALNNIGNIDRSIDDAPFHGWSGEHLEKEIENIKHLEYLFKYCKACCDVILGENND